jgi:RNA polymerase sigma-70 factor (sigma-E family)
VSSTGAAEAAFAAFVEARSAALLRAGWLLCGDWQLAEDLVQGTLLDAWRHWARLDAVDSRAAYVHRMLTNRFLSSRRRRQSTEIPVRAIREVPVDADPTAAADLRQTVRAALAALPARQRAVLVLRYFLDLSEAQTAQALGCSPGTVKSQSAKALQSLRRRPSISSLFDEVHG